MSRTNLTTSVNSELKEKAFAIIKYSYRKSFSQWLDEKLLEVIEDDKSK